MTNKTDVVLWDLQLNREQRRLDARTGFTGGGGYGGSFGFSPNGRFLAFASGYRPNVKRSELKIWQLSNFEQVGPDIQNDIIRAVQFTPDSSQLVAACGGGRIKIFNTSTWELERTFQGRSATVMAVSHDGSMLATGGASPVIWDLKTGKLLHVLDGGITKDLKFSTDDKTLAAANLSTRPTQSGFSPVDRGTTERTVDFWDVRTGKKLQRIDVHEESVWSLAFSPTGNTLATLGNEGVLRLWEAAPMEEIESYPPTLDGLLALGALRKNQERYAEAEAILRRLHELQVERLGADHPDIRWTKLEMADTLKRQGKMPAIARQPTSATANLGDEINFSVELAEQGLWDMQWFRNGKPIDGATSPQLVFNVENESAFGAYHVEVAPAGRADTKPIRSEFGFLVEKELGQNLGLHWEVFNDTPELEFSDLEKAESFQGSPTDKRTVVDHFEKPTTAGKNYVGRLMGWLVPPVTGEYVFDMSARGQGALFLDEPDSSEGEKAIVRSRGWKKTSIRWKSQPVQLERGKRYRLRALYKQRGVGDYFAVRWQLPGQPPPETYQPPIPSPPIPGLFLRHSLE